jgi:hypothetical protein
MDEDTEEVSDAEFLAWAGNHPQRWAMLPAERREAWVDHLVARIRAATDERERDGYWRLAYTIAGADAVRPSAYELSRAE